MPWCPTSVHTIVIAALDEQEIPGAEVDNVARTVVPTRNAIVKVQYDTRIGYKAMLTLRTRSGWCPSARW